MVQARLGADLQAARDEVLWLEHSNQQSDAQEARGEELLQRLGEVEGELEKLPR